MGVGDTIHAVPLHPFPFLERTFNPSLLDRVLMFSWFCLVLRMVCPAKQYQEAKRARNQPRPPSLPAKIWRTLPEEDIDDWTGHSQSIPTAPLRQCRIPAEKSTSKLRGKRFVPLGRYFAPASSSELLSRLRDAVAATRTKRTTRLRRNRKNASAAKEA